MSTISKIKVNNTSYDIHDANYGSTSISSIGDGTITGAISELYGNAAKAMSRSCIKGQTDGKTAQFEIKYISTDYRIPVLAICGAQNGITGGAGVLTLDAVNGNVSVLTLAGNISATMSDGVLTVTTSTSAWGSTCILYDITYLQLA